MWVIPIVAAAAGVWIAVTKILEKGPEITIVFSSAEGLVANKTKVNYNGLDIGTLTSIKLAEDRKHVIATAAMSPMSHEFLVKDAKFWVVKPRISGLNVTGLGTLISGNYIGVQLGQSKESERHFVALESPPLTGDVPGTIFMLKTPELGSLGEGTPIYYRQLPAGQVISYELDKDGAFLNVKIFVESPYDQFVTQDTRFWQASGVDVSLTRRAFMCRPSRSCPSWRVALPLKVPLPMLFRPRRSQTPSSPCLMIGPPPSNRRHAISKPICWCSNNQFAVFPLARRWKSAGLISAWSRNQPQFDAKKMEFSVPVTVQVDPQRYGVKFLNFRTATRLAPQP